MCNLDSIYALIVLESVAYEKRPLRSMPNSSQSEIAADSAVNSADAGSSWGRISRCLRRQSCCIQTGRPYEKPPKAIRFAGA